MTEKTLVKVAPESLGTLLPYLPDTPWTTPPLHVVQQRHGDAYVDSAESPRQFVVVARGVGTREDPHQAFVFGTRSADGVRDYVANIRGHVEFVCDPDVAEVVRELHPDATPRESVVCWYDYLDVQVELPEGSAARRLRMADSVPLEDLLPAWAFRTFPTAKNLILGGTVFGVFENDELVSAAFTQDHSVKFERVAVVTRQDARRRGFGHAALAKLVSGCPDRGRIPCCVIPRDNVAAYRLARKVGFPKSGVLRSYLAS